MKRVLYLYLALISLITPQQSKGSLVDTSLSSKTFILRIDSLGNEIDVNFFSKNLSFGWPWGRFVQQSGDQDYVVAGTSEKDLCLIKINTLADELNSKAYSFDLNLTSLEKTHDHGYILLGEVVKSLEDSKGGSANVVKNSDIRLIKIDSLADTSWTRLFGWNLAESMFSIKETNDHGYVLIGVSNSFSKNKESEMLFIKTDSIGVIRFKKTFPGFAGFDISSTRDGNYMITGVKTSEYNNTSSVVLLKVNSLGDSLWEKTYGPGCGFIVNETRDSGYIVVARVDHLFWLIKIDQFGNIQWKKSYGDEHSECYSIQQTADGGYIFTGRADTKTWFVRTNSEGNIILQRTYANGKKSTGYWVYKTNTSSYIIIGSCLVAKSE